MTNETEVREHLRKVLNWQEAHVGFDAAVAGIPPGSRGEKPAPLPYTPWQLVEHLRITQQDILDFCRNPKYEEIKWPDDYWPSSAAPPSDAAWEKSLEQFRKDREAMQQLAADPIIDLTARIPHGNGQTYLREILLVADHTAYHIGELIVVRRLLGIWKR
jgi:hypothetical protein